MTYYIILITALALYSGCTSKKIKTQKELEDEILKQEVEREINDPSFGSNFTDGCNPSPYVSGCMGMGTIKPTSQNTNPKDPNEIERKKLEEEIAKKIRDAFNVNP